MVHFPCICCALFHVSIVHTDLREDNAGRAEKVRRMRICLSL